MKRTALKWGAALVACAGVFYLGACGDTVYDGRQDTVLTLDAPRVTAKAYPGVNIVSWEPVTGAQGYTVYVYENGVSKGTLSRVGSAYLCLDTDLVNNTEYTYHVEAKSDSNPGTTTPAKAVYAQNSRGKASVKAIVPPAGTKALGLAAYEGGYDGKTAKTLDATKDEYVLTADRIKLDVDAPNGQVYVDFPMKAYLDYTVKYYNTDLDRAVVDDVSSATITAEIGETGDDTTNNVTGHYAFTIDKGGTYQVAITAKSRNSAYPSSEEIVAGKVEVKKLNLNEISMVVNADYLYKSLNDKTVRVKFPRLTKADGSFVPASWYKVYRRVAGEYDTTAVTAAIKTDLTATGFTSSNNDKVYYYLDDTVPSVDVEYQYIVVITDGEAYASFVGKTVPPVAVKTNPSGISIEGSGFPTPAANDDGSVLNSVTWTITTTATKSAIKAYVLAEDSDRYLKSEYLQSEIESKGKPVTDSLSANAEGNGYTLVTAGLTSTSGDYGTAYLLVVVNESGKDEVRKVLSGSYRNK